MTSIDANDAVRRVETIAAALLDDFGEHLSSQDGPSASTDEGRRALLSRALAALVVKARTGADDKTAAGAVTDGSHDFGIDAVGIVPGVPRLWLVQAKWSDRAEGRFGEDDVRTVVDGLRRVDHQEVDQFNPRLAQYSDQIKAILADRQCRVTLVLALMRRDPLSAGVVQRLDEVKEQFNVHGDYLDYEVLYVRDIWDILRREAAPEPISLSVSVDRWFDLSTPMRAVSGVALAGEIASWYAEHGSKLFARNIRESLGVTRINADIGRTLLNEPSEFWYRNNGITLLCDRLDLHPRSKMAPHGPAVVDASNASIINGAQTVAAIARAVAENPLAGQGYVGVRVIESTDSAAGAAITKATNTQNHIERRDFVALDETQIAIRDDFTIGLDLNYSIRRSEFEPSPESGCTVREAALALACAHPNPDLARRAGHNEDLLWEEGPRGIYGQIFAPRPSATQIWRSVLLYRSIRDALRRSQGVLAERGKALIDYGSLVIAHLVFQQIGRDGVDDPDADWSTVLQRTPATVEISLNRLVSELETNFKGAFLRSTFESEERVRELVRGVMSAVDAGADAPPLPADYRRPVAPRKKRSRNAVSVLVDAGRIKDGTQLRYQPSTPAEQVAMQAWLAADPARGSASWVNSRSAPLIWATDGKAYSPSGLVMRMWQLAEWEESPVAAQGTTRWLVAGEGTLVALARTALTDSGLSLEETAE